jgi:serine/threonine protein kinase
MVAWELLERYQVVRVLARSAHAQVYVARNRATRDLAALKVIDRSLAGHLKATGRLRDARAIAAARLPGVVAIDAVSCTSDDGAFVAGELLEGMSLAARLGRGPLPCVDAILFCLQVGLALCEGRDRGIVHGGVKPANVFVVPDPRLPRGERALLADFGTASPRSLAPSTDVRDLASLLHLLVTGAPYAGESASRLIERGVAAVVAVHIARSWREVSIEATVAALEQLAATWAIDADPTDCKLPLRPPPRDATPGVAAAASAASERTAMFTLVDPDELDVSSDAG